MGTLAARSLCVEFALFIVVSAALFIRPGEVVPALLGLPVYEVPLVAALLVAAPRVLRQLQPAALRRQPITACVLALLPAVVLSHLPHLFLWGMKNSGILFAKVVLFYLVMVAVVNTPSRLRRLLVALAAFALVLTAIALLQYHEVIEVPSLTTLRQGELDENGEVVFIARLRSTGIYNDPNDLGQMLVAGALISLCGLGALGPRHLRPLWLGPLALFGYALVLTHSRGAFLALLAGLTVLFRARFGWRRAVVLVTLTLPVLFVLASGRQADLSTSGGTSQDRIQLWSQGLDLLRQSPLLGTGMGTYEDHCDLVAHNSYVHCFTELGLLGGALFLGAFLAAILTLRRAGEATAADPRLERLRPYLLAIVTAYAVGLFSLSRPYTVSTYVFFGLAAVYGRLAFRTQAPPGLRLDACFARRLALASATFLVGIYFFVRTFARWG
jgi:O-antigen ligase